jgi:hypothetical protein
VFFMSWAFSPYSLMVYWGLYFAAILARASFIAEMGRIRAELNALKPIPDDGDWSEDEIAIDSQIYDRGDCGDNICVFVRRDDENSSHPRQVLVDYSEREIPPSEGHVRKLAALRILRETHIVPKLIESKSMDPRLVLTSYVGAGSMQNVRYRLPVSRIVEIGIRLLGMLKVVHSEYGIIHGNLVSKNIVYSWDTMVESIRLTGWQDAVSVEDVDDAAEALSESKKYKMRKKSLFGEFGRRNFRDDVAQIAELVVNLMCGNEDMFASEYEARNIDPDSLRNLRLRRGGELRLMFPDIPSAVIDFYEYCIGMKSSDVPSYDVWITQLHPIVDDPRYALPLGQKSPIDLRGVLIRRASQFRNLRQLHADPQFAVDATLLHSKYDISIKVYDRIYGVIQPFREYLADRPDVRVSMCNLARLAITFLDLLQKLHAHGIVHNGIGLDSFFFITDDLSPNGKWRVDNFDRATLFVNPVDWVHVAKATGSTSRRDDVLALAIMMLRIVVGRDEICSSGSFGCVMHTRFEIFGLLFRHASSLGFFDRPDYEAAGAALATYCKV